MNLELTILSVSFAICIMLIHKILTLLSKRIDLLKKRTRRLEQEQEFMQQRLEIARVVIAPGTLSGPLVIPNHLVGGAFDDHRTTIGVFDNSNTYTDERTGQRQRYEARTLKDGIIQCSPVETPPLEENPEPANA